MKFNIITMIIALILILCTQIVALFVQYRINKAYRGIGYWLLGSTLMTLGFTLMPMVAIKNLDKLAIIANPLLILGHIYIYIGIKWFFNRKYNKKIISLGFIGFNLLYYYYMFINNSITARTIIISMTLAIISFAISYDFYFKKDRFLKEESIAYQAKFTTSVFFVYGCFFVLRIFATMSSNAGNSYIEQGNSIIATVIISIFFSNLWTFGLIIMVNQRLIIEKEFEKEKIQLIFNTSIDAQLITRLEDGFIAKVNDEFTVLSGYSKDEIIGNSISNSRFWYNYKDRESWIKQLKDKGSCDNMEFVFQKKDNTQFPGLISAKVIIIENVEHIISVVRDITNLKLIELEREKLIKQLEIEKNTAQHNAITDSLTGLYNRGYFDNMLRTEFFRTMRSEAPLSLIMLDIDHFKKFNDSYGHLAGDKCIQMISKTLKDAAKRAPDIAARYGGEEFIVILPDTDEEGAKFMGEKIRKAVEDLAIPHITSETAKYVTVSVGVVNVYPVNLVSPEEVLKMVDQALYKAKETGRNRCIYMSNT